MDKNFSNPLSNTFTDVHQAISFGEAKNKSFLSKMLSKVRKGNCDDGIAPYPHCDLSTWRW